MSECCDNPKYEDTGVHTYECKNCRTVGYYSGAAKNYYEGNVTEQNKWIGEENG